MLVVILAVLALAASLSAVWMLRERNFQAREAQAFEQGERVVDTLSKRIGSGFTSAALAALTAEQLAALREFESSLITPLDDASTGFCLPGGELAQVATVAAFAFEPDFAKGKHPREAQPPGAHLLPLDREIIEDTCAALRGSELGRKRSVAPNDVLFITARKVSPDLAVFALVRTPNRANDELGWGWRATVALLCAFTLLLVIVTMHLLAALRRSTRQVEESLSRLRHDLRAPVETPRVAELARIADALRSMASDLATTRERERGLESRLAHEQRLSGLGRVVAGVAHEIRNPLAGMKLKLDLLVRRDLDARARQDIEVCLVEIARLDRIVSSLLLVSRREPVQRESCDLGALVRERADGARPLAAEQEVRLEVGGAALACAHREHTVRILDNLIRNAIEASPAGGTVSLRVEAAATEGAVVVRVVDEGEGVPAEHIERLFEPFFTSKPEGTGLGLFLSRSLAEQQGGSVSYIRDGKKTSFQLTLASA